MESHDGIKVSIVLYCPKHLSCDRLTPHKSLIFLNSSFFLTQFILYLEITCEMNPCENQGICKQNANNYTCLCPEGLSGINCELGV